MKRLLCNDLPTQNHPVLLGEEERNHAHQVLRLKQGSIVEVLNGKGEACTARLEYQDERALLVFESGISQLVKAPPGEVLPITIEAAVLKGAAFEWLVEKITELGVFKLIPIKTHRTIVRWDRKPKEKLIARWQKISDQSLKQCGRLHRLKIDTPVDLSSVLQTNPIDQNELRIWCDEYAKDDSTPHLFQSIKGLKNPSSIRLLIGPEGGFEPEEAELIRKNSMIQSLRTSLGPIVMRAETACIYATSLISGFFRSNMH